MSRPTATPAEEARVRILRAAERLFAEKGYAAASIQEITEAAAVNRALPYYYFEDKHSLYASVIADGTAEFDAMLEAALTHPGSASDRLAAFVRGHLELIWRRPLLARIIHRCRLDGLQEEVGLVERFRATVDRLEAFLGEAMASGEFRDADPRITARTLVGPTFIFSLWKLYEGDRFEPAELARQITGQLLHGLRNPDTP